MSSRVVDISHIKIILFKSEQSYQYHTSLQCLIITLSFRLRPDFSILTGILDLSPVSVCLICPCRLLQGRVMDHEGTAGTRGIANPFLGGDKDAESTIMKSSITSWSNRPKWKSASPIRSESLKKLFPSSDQKFCILYFLTSLSRNKAYINVTYVIIST